MMAFFPLLIYMSSTCINRQWKAGLATAPEWKSAVATNETYLMNSNSTSAVLETSSFDFISSIQTKISLHQQWDEKDLSLNK